MENQNLKWLYTWEQNSIGFHLPEANPNLVKYWNQLFSQKGSRVLVPLCGKSLDMLWLARQGHEVVGVELSPIAARSFFEENNLHFEIVDSRDSQIFFSEKIQIIVTDFFSLSTEIAGCCDHVYDRGSLIALKPKLHRQYVERIEQLTSPEASHLLITLEYHQEIMIGPPFSVNQEHIKNLYPHLDVSILHCEDIIEHEERFKYRGLTELLNVVYTLKPK